ncbi:four helix bundle protein [Spirosoma luteolum]
MEAHNFRERKVWQMARLFVRDVYVASSTFPAEERFGLTSQLRRAVISVPLNIAEGSGRSDKDFARFLGMSLSSAYEVETQLLLACDLGFITESKLASLSQTVQEIQRMIYGLQRRINKNFLSVFLIPVPLLVKLLVRK